jgi:hypothetical protein
MITFIPNDPLAKTGPTNRDVSQQTRWISSLRIPPTGVGGWFKSFLQQTHKSPPAIPPTVVGG